MRTWIMFLDRWQKKKLVTVLHCGFLFVVLFAWFANANANQLNIILTDHLYLMMKSFFCPDGSHFPESQCPHPEISVNWLTLLWPWLWLDQFQNLNSSSAGYSNRYTWILHLSCCIKIYIKRDAWTDGWHENKLPLPLTTESIMEKKKKV